ncbi:MULTISPECIES: hypothetical protein [unclassified Burkholderia]|uniref:hypothetical protein n=1 Tax=unclassified Burkholderia TaxID=2613784 RepID=UPI000F5AFAFA|nr:MULTISPECIES: hypothetical protein [unclassified Burkholderia]RQS17492.1 hypothetical protein DIE05_37395 [Burkholderia sp. Bp8995]RQS37899.1 hypothetical protein DIE00_37270 [Burkholderia sp. Bp8989]
MILRPQQIYLVRLGLPATPCNGGSSDSETKTSNQNVDQRLDVGGGGVGATASSGGSVNINVTPTDAGSIQQSFGLAHDALHDVTAMGTSSVSASAHTAELAINGALDTINGAQDAYTKATAAVADAWKSAGKQAASAQQGALSAVMDANQSAMSSVSAAYQDSKTGNQRVIVIGALVVVGLVVLAPVFREAA